jgi:energy-coupling factor transporter ATP-binding protein EcfA2
VTDNPLPFRDVHIGAFRRLRGVSLRDCTPINLVVGDNNSGKTSLLEALTVCVDPFHPNQWRLATQLRGAWPFQDREAQALPVKRLDLVAWLFPRTSEERGEISIDVTGSCPLRYLRAECDPISGVPPLKTEIKPHSLIEGVYQSQSGGPTRGLHLTIKAQSTEWRGWQHLESGYETCQMALWELGGGDPLPKPNPLPPLAFATPISHRSDSYLISVASRLQRKKVKDSTLSLLQQIDERITDFMLVAPEFGSGDSIDDYQAGAHLHVEYDGRGLVPIHSLGDGIRRAFHFAALISEIGPGGVLLVDEVEVGMHTSVLRQVFRWLCDACVKEGIQLFTTTHSLEAVDAILSEAPAEALSLFRISGERTKKYSGEVLKVARVELGQEVR